MAMEWFAPLETALNNIVTLAKFSLELISVLCVLLGLVKTLQLALSLYRHRYANPFPFNEVRLRFGTWLALALEFQLGADILGTTVAPTPQALIRLALIAVIRTFLNYFLSKELEAQSKLRQEHQAALAAGHIPADR